MPAKLLVLRGRHVGNEFVLDGRAVFDVGSSPGAEGFRLDEPGVAATHCRIFREDTRFSVFDLCGQGILVNDKKVARGVLQDRDEIAIGSATLQFLSAPASTQGKRSPVARLPFARLKLTSPPPEPWSSRSNARFPRSRNDPWRTLPASAFGVVSK